MTKKEAEKLLKSRAETDIAVTVETVCEVEKGFLIIYISESKPKVRYAHRHQRALFMTHEGNVKNDIVLG